MMSSAPTSPPVVVITLLAALLVTPASFSQTACLDLDTAQPCEDLEDSSSCEAIRGQFCDEDREDCQLEVVQSPSNKDLVYVLGPPCRLEVAERCIGLFRRFPGGGIVVAPPTPEPDWHPQISLIENLSRELVEGRFLSGDASRPLSSMAGLGLESCPANSVDWPWTHVVRSVESPDLPRYRSLRPVRLALIDGGISPFVIEAIEKMGIRVIKGSSTHPTELDQDVVSLEAHVHGTQMASAIAKTLDRFMDPGQLDSVELIVYRSFIDNCAPAISLVPAIQDVMDKGYEILVIAAEMRTGNETIRKALIDAVDAGVLVVVATPNESRVQIDATTERFPASWNTDGLLVVSAVDACDRHVGARGVSAVDLFAPGQNIPVYDETGGGERKDGSSLAAAIVGALAAITLSQLPSDFRASELERFLVEGVHAVESLQGEARSGGIIDLAYSIKLARAATNPPR